MLCPSCGHENRAGRRFCAQCGAALGLTCPSCGASTEPGERFCGECGRSLSSPPKAPLVPASRPETPNHLAQKILSSRSALEGERKFHEAHRLFLEIGAGSAVQNKPDGRRRSARMRAACEWRSRRCLAACSSDAHGSTGNPRLQRPIRPRRHGR